MKKLFIVWLIWSIIGTSSLVWDYTKQWDLKLDVALFLVVAGSIGGPVFIISDIIRETSNITIIKKRN